jgi:hypothetical protein
MVNALTAYRPPTKPAVSSWLPSVKDLLTQDVQLRITKAARTCNTFRAIEHRASQFSRMGEVSYSLTNLSFKFLPRRNVFAEALSRDVDTKRNALADIQASVFDHNIVEFIDLLLKVPTTNSFAMSRLKQIADLVMGDHPDKDSAMRHLRRSMLHLHPDKRNDLKGWSVPGTVYWGTTKDLKVQHAVLGAESLMELHDKLKQVFQDQVYAQVLFWPETGRAGRLTLSDVAEDVCGVPMLILVAAAICVFFISGKFTSAHGVLKSASMFNVING